MTIFKLTKKITDLEKKIKLQKDSISMIEGRGLTKENLIEENAPASVKCSECLTRYPAAALIRYRSGCRKSSLSCPLCQNYFVSKASISKIKKMEATISSLRDEICERQLELKKELDSKILKVTGIIKNMDGNDEEVNTEFYGPSLNFNFRNLEIFSHGSYGEDRASDYRERIRSLISEVKKIFPECEVNVYGQEKHYGTLSVQLS